MTARPPTRRPTAAQRALQQSLADQVRQRRLERAANHPVAVALRNALAHPDHLTVLAAALLTATAALDDPGGPARDALASFHAAVRAAGGHAPLSDLLGAIVLAHVRATLATIPARH